MAMTRLSSFLALKRKKYCRLLFVHRYTEHKTSAMTGSECQTGNHYGLTSDEGIENKINLSIFFFLSLFYFGCILSDKFDGEINFPEYFE